MNTLMIVALAVVALCYCGGRFCPKVLYSNKEMVLGVLIGMALCSFAGLKLEGYECSDEFLEESERVCDSIETGARQTTSDPRWSNTTTEDINSFLNRFCNNMGPFPGAGITENRVLTPEDDEALSIFPLRDGKLRLSQTNDAERSGCGFCERPEVREAIYPENPRPCVNLYDSQQGAGQCAFALSQGYTCEQGAENSFTSGPYIGYCDRECGVCQGN